MAEGEARVQAAVDGLDYDFRQFTIPHFIAHIQTLRQRDIILTGVSFDRGLHGFWVQADTADYVFFNRRTHEIHQVHHILHELGHIVLEHRLRDLAAFLPPELVTQLRVVIAHDLQGHCRQWDPHDTLEEREAEWFVRCLQREILLTGRLSALTHPDTSIRGLGRFTRSLGYDD
jgi:hypothetical protein